MIKLLLIIFPIAAVSWYCWHYGTLRSTIIILLLDILLGVGSVYSMNYYAISFMDFIRLSHDSSLLTFELIIIVVLTVSLLLNWLAIVHRWHKKRSVD